MVSIATPDLSFIDIDEMGIRPANLFDEESGIGFDSSNQEKSVQFDHFTAEFYPMIDEKSHSEEDLHFEIDPETGEKTLRQTVIASTHSFPSSPTDCNWIEEYLSTLPISHLQTESIRSEGFSSNGFCFLQHDNDWKDSKSFSKYFISNNNLIMENKNNGIQSMPSPIFIPNSNDGRISSSFDDEQSTESSSNSDQRRHYQSPTGSDSTTSDSEISFKGHFIQPKSEKIEYDETRLTPMFIRRSSTRSNCQGQQDEEILQRYQIPLTVFDITQSSTEEYNRHLARLNYLSTEQIHIIKDIRRRGKNKIAAQNCRKRKATSVETLAEEVDELKRLKQNLEEQKRTYQTQIDKTRHQYEYLHQQVLPNRQLPPAIFVK